MKYQNLPLPPPPSSRINSLNPHSPASAFPNSPTSPKYSPNPGVRSLNPISPATGSYPSNSPTSPKYSPASANKHSDHQAPSYVPRSPSVRQSHRQSLTPSDLPEYRSMYSIQMDNHVPVATASKSTQKDNRYTSYHLPSASRYSPPSPHAQVAASSIPPLKNENRPPFQYLQSIPSSLNNSSSGSNLSSQEPHGDSASLSGHSGLSSPPSTPTSNGTWQPPAPPPSPNFFFPGSRSVARPRVTSKITISHLKKRRSKSRLRAARSQTSLISSLSPTSPSADQMAFESPPVSPIAQTPIQSNHPDIWSEEGAIVPSDDYIRKVTPSVPKAPPETFVFPTARSRAQPKISSKPKSSKRSRHSSRNRDENSGRSRFIGALFKKKNKGKTPNITPSNTYTKISDPVVSTTVEPTSPPPERRVSDESSHEFTVHQEPTKKLKSKSWSYPLDPYNSVLLDKLSRLVFYFSRYSCLIHSYLAIAIQANSYRDLIKLVRPVFMIMGITLLRPFLILDVDKGK